MNRAVVGGVLAVVVILSIAPLWGGCDINDRLCAVRCVLRHFDSGIQQAACKTACAAEKAACAAGRGTRQAGELLDRIAGPHR